MAVTELAVDLWQLPFLCLLLVMQLQSGTVLGISQLYSENTIPCSKGLQSNAILFHYLDASIHL